MFKAIGNFLHRTPWWALVLLGFSTLLLLVLFAYPLHVQRLQESGSTPEEQRAIKREIDRAFGDSALNVAENIVGALKNRSTDPARREELDHALTEIAQARHEIFNAQREAKQAAEEVVRQTQEAALEAAQDATQAALDAAIEAREAIEEARRETEEKLKSAGADAKTAMKAFEETLTAAKARENSARDAVKSIKETIKQAEKIKSKSGGNDLKIDLNAGGKGGVQLSVDSDGVKNEIHIPVGEKGVTGSPPPKVPTPSSKTTPTTPTTPTRETTITTPTTPTTPSTNKGVDFNGTIAGNRVKGNINIDDNGKVSLNLPPIPPEPLPPALRSEIRSRVADDVRRIGVGSIGVLSFIPIFIMLLIAKFLVDRSRRATAFAEQKKQEAEVSNVNRQITEARLQALQAQVEPHFLYNTLANVQALTEVDPAAANQMTGHLIQYLRSALPKMRENTSTIGQEIELVRAYLNILKMRMGDRLAFDIECPTEMLGIGFPPLMLPSLVENAIKHGLEPQREGGRIDVIVTPIMTAAGQRVRLTVKDTGRGLTDTPTQAGGGVGLTNIRERLIAIYGEDGKLTLESNEPKGVIASIEVPAETGPIPSAGTSAGGAQGFATRNAPPAKPVPKGWWGRTRYAIAATHGVWTKVMTVTFITLMVALAVVFGLALAGLYTGMLPMNIGTTRLDGIEGMALGTVGLLIAFGAVALVLVVIVAVLYGLGVLFAGLLAFIPLMLAISLFPALAPVALIGVAIYWFWWRKREKKSPTPPVSDTPPPTGPAS